MMVYSGDEAFILHKQTTLGQPELVATEKIRNISTLKSRKSPKLPDKKDAKHNLKLVKNSINTGISPRSKSELLPTDQ